LTVSEQRRSVRSAAGVVIAKQKNGLYPEKFEYGSTMTLAKKPTLRLKHCVEDAAAGPRVWRFGLVRLRTERLTKKMGI
jgi:hypothetical protein